jgi:hypothetical protein
VLVSCHSLATSGEQPRSPRTITVNPLLAVLGLTGPRLLVGPVGVQAAGWWRRLWRGRSGQVVKGAIGPDGVVLDPPILDQHLGLKQGIEGLDGEQVVA